ncbi:hypothetical protein EYF80_001096 [Liparis tanakae]|uniref:Uncharacterized protein n=1 Tax=Liparis tanakae TaxID=230148 RepID=A0A4Z2JG47_9TELE|nr:hypothetical protein EYF80_001096 [Liparis tanakae]
MAVLSPQQTCQPTIKQEKKGPANAPDGTAEEVDEVVGFKAPTEEEEEAAKKRADEKKNTLRFGFLVQAGCQKPANHGDAIESFPPKKQHNHVDLFRELLEYFPWTHGNWRMPSSSEARVAKPCQVRCESWHVSGSDSPAVSGASVRCLERQCACVAERRERGCTVLRTGSAGHHRRTALDNPGWWWRGRLDPDREQEQDREHHRGSFSPLSENMSEFFLLALLALFSGLFPCAEPSAVSGEDRGKEESGPSGLRSPADHDLSAGQKGWCRAPSGNGGGQRTGVRAAEAWLGTLSPSCHLAQTEGSELHHADLAQKTRTGEGFIHPPTRLVLQTNLRPIPLQMGFYPHYNNGGEKQHQDNQGEGGRFSLSEGGQDETCVPKGASETRLACSHTRKAPLHCLSIPGGLALRTLWQGLIAAFLIPMDPLGCANAF